jgi:asparagine synthase (glutamine-hydrolysing)
VCGITGIYRSATGFSEELIRARLQAMTETLRLRGPDDLNIILNDDVGLGHTRLSIQDLTDAGAQPMRFGLDKPIIVFNGEIYNTDELRRKINQKEVVEWRGHSDTEVILRLYETMGLQGLKMLEGIFAIAIWDCRIKRLVLMRDRLGIKPLYYGESKIGLVFGSEIKAVLAAGGVNTALNEQALSEYLWYGNTHGENTFYQGVDSLKPGHWLIVEDEQISIGELWRIEDWLD